MTNSEKDRRKALRDAFKAQQRRDKWDTIGLDRDSLDSLLDYLEEEMAESPCDHTLRHCEAWAKSEGIPWGDLKKGLQDSGGFCDCGVLLNVDPDET